MLINYTGQDLLSLLLAILLFTTVFILPGYVIGWSLNLFDFQLRRPFVRFQIALILSVAISPILFFLALRFFSPTFTSILALIFLALFLFILFRTPGSLSIFTGNRQDRANEYIKYALWVALGWIILVISTLIELQLGDRLYYNVVAHDFSTRTAIIDAITRTGVPPVNPGYFPGHPVYITYLYYFWYVLCSLIDRFGGAWVDAREAMMASVAWCGLALMSTIALYLRLRNPKKGTEIWKSALLGVGLLFISGADIIAVLLISLVQNIDYLGGDIEHWNEQITAWIGSLTWVPHHVAAVVACLVAIMLLLYAPKQGLASRIPAMIIAGIAFASGFGLSVFVTIVFAIFWGVWLITRLIQKDWGTALLMSISGIVGLAAISPFLLDLLGKSGSAATSFPLTIAVRSFWPVGIFIQSYPKLARDTIYLLVLPINYFLELGFFFVVGVVKLTVYRKDNRRPGRFFLTETILLLISGLIGSFVRSTVIFSNDIGWRAWLPGQFILLVWGVDIIEIFFYRDRPEKTATVLNSKQITLWLKMLLIIGLLTTLLDVALLRTWPLFVDSGLATIPNSFSPDTQLGKRTFASRQAYEYINNHLDQNAVIQINPTEQVDRTVGLYATRQVAVSVHTAYGVPEQDLENKISEVAQIFRETDLRTIDQSCKRNFINTLVINDLDELWSHLPTLEKLRAPLYKNRYYAVFLCGE